MNIFKAIPLMIFPLIIYFAVVLTAGQAPVDGDPNTGYHMAFTAKLMELPMPNGGIWVFTLRDLIMVITLICLCMEVIKATYTRGAGLADQALSIVLFVVFIVLFLLVPQAQTSLFFLITFTVLIDVICGAIVGIRTARRDIGFGGDVG